MIGRARTSFLIALAITACAAAEGAPSQGPRGGSPSPSATPSEAACQGTGYFEPLPVGAACWIDVATDGGAPVRVSYTIPALGWSAFIGSFKEVEGGNAKQLVSVLIARVQNVTVDACETQVAATPAVGPSVDDLARALAELPPFEVSVPPAAAAAWGYSGTHLQIRIPSDQPFSEETGRFVGCDGSVLESWIAPPLGFAFYGYAAPGDTEDYWILDVQGTRVVIVALASANASAELVAERQAILDSIVIAP